MLLRLENSVLGHVMGEHAEQADAHITLARTTFDDISLQRRSFLAAVASGDAVVQGNPLALGRLMGLLDSFTPMFEIVTPLGSERR